MPSLMKDWGISASSLTLSDIVAVVVVVVLMLDAGCWLAVISGGRDSARWTGTWQRDQIAPFQHGSSQGRGGDNHRFGVVHLPRRTLRALQPLRSYAYSKLFPGYI